VKVYEAHDENRKARYFFVGRLAEQKRPLDLIEVARIVGKTDLPIEFVMVGSGPLAEACERKIGQLNLSNISMRPFVDNVAEVYEAADAIIFVSEYEGLPIVMLEALASGVPVLATDVGDIRLVAGQLGGGCQVIDDAIGRPDLLANALIEFHRNLASHKQAAAHISGAVRERFGSDNVARQYFDSWTSAWQAFAEQDLRR
jgi:glycosyltransferase involved in cell wall biosynthesis